jgi:hypothetical protein
MNEEPCGCFNEWLERNPNKDFYDKLPPDVLSLVINAWNAGWCQGWKRLEYRIKQNVNAE